MLEHARPIYLYMCHVCGVYSHDIPMNLHIYSHSILIHTQIPWLLGKHVIIHPMDSYDTVDGCEILHHQPDGWNPTNNGINHRFQLVQDFHDILITPRSVTMAMAAMPATTLAPECQHPPGGSPTSWQGNPKTWRSWKMLKSLPNMNNTS